MPNNPNRQETGDMQQSSEKRPRDLPRSHSAREDIGQEGGPARKSELRTHSTDRTKIPEEKLPTDPLDPDFEK